MRAYVAPNIETVAVLQCCSSLKGIPYHRITSILYNIYINIYIINIGLFFDFRRICFGTATLQRCNVFWGKTLCQILFLKVDGRVPRV